MRKYIVYILILLGIISIGIGIKLKNKSADNDDNIVINEQTIEETTTYNGIYQKNDTIIKLYGLTNNRLYYDISGNTGIAIINEDNATATLLDDNYNFKVNDNILTFETNSNKYPSGKYERNNEYTSENLFNDKYGDTTYLDSKYNGDYSSSSYKLYMFQTKENEVIVCTTYNGNTTSLLYSIMDDESLISKIDNNEIKITLKNDSITYKTDSERADMKKFNGTHKKVKSLSIKDILNNIN